MLRLDLKQKLTFVVIALLLTLTATAPLASGSEERAEFLDHAREFRETTGQADQTGRGVVHAFDPNPEPISDVEPEADDFGHFQTVFPPDMRQQISPTTHYPASAVAYVEKWVGGSPHSTCSGTFISADTVLTAAHCLHTQDTGWGSAMRVVPARDGHIEPFGDAFATFGWVPQEWLNNENPEWDWGILSMPDTSLGNTVGWFTMGILPTETLMAPNFNPAIAGYPGDKPIGTMWLSHEPAFIDANHAFLAHRIDTAPGQSGSAVWRGDDGVIVGVHVFGLEEFNLASRVNQELVDWLLDACVQMGCSFDYLVESQPGDPHDPGPDPPVPDGPVFATSPDAQRAVDNFWMTRDRTDFPIDLDQVNRTWMWGPTSNSAAIVEQYIGAPGNSRVVTYFDKSRMEDNEYRADPPWHVTNGLLVVELVTGRMQIGDDTFIDREPADVQVAGDPHPDSPTYAMLESLQSHSPFQIGAAVIRRLDPDGGTTLDNSFIGYGVTTDHMVHETNHSVPSVFWDFMNSTGVVYANGFLLHDVLFENPFFATGFPITEPYWVHVPVGGVWQDVLFQCFQRRCLTYTPGNPPGWEVEAGNVGQHYYDWRYGDAPAFP